MRQFEEVVCHHSIRSDQHFNTHTPHTHLKLVEAFTVRKLLTTHTHTHTHTRTDREVHFRCHSAPLSSLQVTVRETES